MLFHAASQKTLKLFIVVSKQLFLLCLEVLAGGEHEDGCLLGCRAVQTGTSLPTFRPDDGGSTDI
jgi:hypothetical protein